MNRYPILSAADCAKMLLLNKKRVAVAVHRSPDADALGSALALSHIVRALGGAANIITRDTVRESLRFLTEGEEILTELPEDAFLVAVDVASPGQLGELSEYIDRFELMIDHHERGEAFAPNYTVKGAAAAGELVYCIAKELSLLGKDTLTRDVRNFIYAAISDDTGSFRFGNTTPDVMRCAAELLSAGVDSERISHLLHSVRTKAQLRAEKLALQKMNYYCGGKIAAAAISGAEMDAEELKNDDLSEISDKMRSVSGVLVGASLRECERGEWRVSMRANVPVDCASVAAFFGGGGHTQAAGCSISAETEEKVMRVFLPKLEEAVLTYEKSNRDK